MTVGRRRLVVVRTYKLGRPMQIGIFPHGVARIAINEWSRQDRGLVGRGDHLSSYDGDDDDDDDEKQQRWLRVPRLSKRRLVSRPAPRVNATNQRPTLSGALMPATG
uniref:Uncharacterized protein n=1 Tax=Plectus sambesii TaxID=2011161 RepID=A0A914VPV7_9BILA